MKFLVAFVVFATISALYILFYKMNKNIPVPEGVPVISGGCEGCKNTSCGHYPGS